MKKSSVVTLVVVLVFVAVARADDAKQILAGSGVKGGVVVHVGCGDGKLTAALHDSDSLLVHGLDTDAAKVAKAKAHVDSLGLYGRASAEKYDGKNLPHGDNVVNLIVAGLSGASIPLVMKKIGIDPAQSSSIILTTVTDVIGFLAFLSFALMFQKYLIG